MKPGDKVKIFQKPITKEDYEGEAILVEEHRPDLGDGLSMWVVHFPGDDPGANYLRTIYNPS